MSEKEKKLAESICKGLIELDDTGRDVAAAYMTGLVHGARLAKKDTKENAPA